MVSPDFPLESQLEITSDYKSMNRIAVDIDEVLCHFVESMARHNNLTLPKKQIYSYVYRDMFKISEKKSSKMVRDFYNSKEFDDLTPIHGSRAIIQMMRPKIDKIYIITGRQDCVRKKTEDWLDKHYPELFDDLLLTNSFTSNEIPKVDLCKALNIDTIIDDSDVQCDMCAERGVKPVHFSGYNGVDMYPWCDLRETNVLSWDQLYKDNFLTHEKNIHVVRNCDDTECPMKF